MTYYWNGVMWDRLRPFNRGLVRDLKMLYDWDQQHPGEFAFYPDLCIAAKQPESGEVAKLRIWKMAEWGGQTYAKDGNRAAFYRIVEHGKAVHRGEVAFPYDYWVSDETLNYAYQVFIHQVRDGFNLRELRKLYLRQIPPGAPPGSTPPPAPTPIPPTPPSPPPPSGASGELPEALQKKMAEQLKRRQQ